MSPVNLEPGDLTTLTALKSLLYYYIHYITSIPEILPLLHYHLRYNITALIYCIDLSLIYCIDLSLIYCIDIKGIQTWVLSDFT